MIGDDADMPYKNKKLRCTDLVLEITRRCNMKCVHCLRGDAEDLEMPFQILDNVMSRIREVMTLTFTGGEPSLNVPAIRHALQELLVDRLPVGGDIDLGHGPRGRRPKRPGLGRPALGRP